MTTTPSFIQREAIATAILDFGVPCEMVKQGQYAVLSRRSVAEKLAFVWEDTGAVRVAHDYYGKDYALTTDVRSLLVYPTLEVFHSAVDSAHYSLHPPMEALQFGVQIVLHGRENGGIEDMPDFYQRTVRVGDNQHSTGYIAIHALTWHRVKQITQSFAAQPTDTLPQFTEGLGSCATFLTYGDGHLYIAPVIPYHLQLGTKLHKRQIRAIIKQMMAL